MFLFFDSFLETVGSKNESLQIDRLFSKDLISLPILQNFERGMRLLQIYLY